MKASGELHVDAPLSPGDEWTVAELQGGAGRRRCKLLISLCNRGGEVVSF